MLPSTTRSSSTTTITTDLIYYFSKGRRDIVGYPEIKLWTAQRRVTWRQATRLGHWSCPLAPHTIIATITIAMGLIPRCLPWLFGLSRPWPCPNSYPSHPTPYLSLRNPTLSHINLQSSFVFCQKYVTGIQNMTSPIATHTQIYAQTQTGVVNGEWWVGFVSGPSQQYVQWSYRSLLTHFIIYLAHSLIWTVQVE